MFPEFLADDLAAIESFIRRQTTAWKLRIEPEGDDWLAVVESETHEIVGNGPSIAAALAGLAKNLD
jgi:hypothetical protein